MHIAATSPEKGKIGVLIEEHFDATEFRCFNQFFPPRGYSVQYLTYLWNNPKLRFTSNPENGAVEEAVVVTEDVTRVRPEDYSGILIIGAYASDRLRYETRPQPNQPNQAPAVEFMRQAMKKNVKVGTICHSLWLLCADNELLRRRKVTCAHNIIADVRNAGAEIIYDQEGTVPLVIDGNLISGKHPGMVQQFMETFLREIEAGNKAPRSR